MVVEALSEQATEVRLLYAGQEVFAYGSAGRGQCGARMPCTGMNLVLEAGILELRAGWLAIGAVRLWNFIPCAAFGGHIARLSPHNCDCSPHQRDDPALWWRFGRFGCAVHFIYALCGCICSQARAPQPGKRSLRESRERILALMHNEIFLGMLTNPEYDFEAEYVRIGFPWVAQEKPFLLAVCQEQRDLPHFDLPGRAGLRASAHGWANLFAVLVRGRRPSTGSARRTVRLPGASGQVPRRFPGAKRRACVARRV